MPKSKSKSESKKELSPRERRKLAWESKQKNSSTDEKVEREAFRKFFAKIKGKLKLEKDMEKVIWLHLKATGFDKKDKFEKGIKHFGYELK